MILVLTRKGDGVKILVSVENVKFWEPDVDGGTHVVFGSDMVRVVNETLAQIQVLMVGGTL